MRTLGTHTLVERSPSMWETYMFVCCRKRRSRHRSSILMTMSGSHQSFNTVTLRINATGEYLLLVLGAVLRLRMALLFLCWPRQDAIFSAGSGTRHQAKKCAAQRKWEYIGLCMVKRDLSASSLTWFGVVDPCTERCDVEFLFVSMEW